MNGTCAYRFRNFDGKVIAQMHGFRTLADAISHAQASPIWDSIEWEYFELKGPQLDWLESDY